MEVEGREAVACWREEEAAVSLFKVEMTTIWAGSGFAVELKRTPRAEVKAGRSWALMDEETSWSRRGRRRGGGRREPSAWQLSGLSARLVEVRNTAAWSRGFKEESMYRAAEMANLNWEGDREAAVSNKIIVRRGKGWRVRGRRWEWGEVDVQDVRGEG